MIIVFLIIIIVALIVANILISILVPKKRKEKGFTNIANNSIQELQEPEVIQNNHLENISERTTLMDSRLVSINQKIGIINERMTNLEKAVTTLIDSQIKHSNNSNNSEQKLINSNTEIDIEKIDFKIKNLEQQIDEIKKPKNTQQTFYGKVDPKMESKIKSLAFNKK